MANTSKEKIKLYVVIGLSVVAALLAYIRFVRKPTQGPGSRPAPGVAESVYEIPELPAWLSGDSPLRLAESFPYRRPPRDIFAPADAASGKRRLAGENGGRLRLSAVMMGPQGRLAVINNQVFGVGQHLGAYTVAEIGEREVVLLKGSTKLVLMMGE